VRFGDVLMIVLLLLGVWLIPDWTGKAVRGATKDEDSDE